MMIKRLKHKQSGVATMVISLVLLVSIGLMSIYTAQVSVMDQRISGNNYRAKQAFEAAQAGLNNAVYNLNMSVIENSICTGSGTATDEGEDSICQDLKASDGQGDLTGNLEQLSVDTPSGQAIGNFQVKFNQHETLPHVVKFTVTGYAGDNAVADGKPNITITQNLIMTSLLAYNPPAPLIARDDVDLDNNVTITNTFPDTLAGIWSGGDLDAGGATINVTRDGVTGGNYANQVALDKDHLSPDEFFENFFSERKEDMIARATLNNAFLDCESGCSEGDLNTIATESGSNVIWVDAKDASGDYEKLELKNSITLGTTANPIILIVDGELVLDNADAKIVGLVYTTQDFGDGSHEGRIEGSLITEDDIKLDDVDNNIVIEYDSAMFTNMNRKTARFTRIAGSWKDF